MKTTKRSGAVQTVAQMMALTLLAKAAGLLRSVLFASRFGASTVSAAFSAASRIPTDAFDLLFGAAIPGCLIPLYVQVKTRDAQLARRFAGDFLGGILLLCGGMAAAVALGAPQWIELFAGGLSEDGGILAVKLLRLLSPVILCGGAVYGMAGLLQADACYLRPAAVSLVSNFVLVLWLFLCRGPADTAYAAAFAVIWLFSWLCQIGILLPALLRRRLCLLPRMTRETRPLLRQVIRDAPAVAAGAWLLPASGLIATAQVSRCPDAGALTLYDCGYTVWAMISGILTLTVCNYAFPRMSEAAAAEDGSAFRRAARRGLIFVMCAGLLAGTAVMLLSHEMIRILYLHGAMTEADAALAADVLRVLSAAMPLYAVHTYGTRVCYAAGAKRIPAAAALCGAGAHALTAVLLRTYSAAPACAALAFIAGQFTAAAVTALCLTAKGYLRRTQAHAAETAVWIPVLTACICMTVSAGMLPSLGGGAFADLLRCAAVAAAGGIGFAAVFGISHLCRAWPETRPER